MAEHEGRSYALRVTFEYEGAEVRKISQQRVEMIAHPSHPTRGYEGQVGFWYELRDANNKIVYRRVIHNPMETHYEVPSPDGRFTRRPVRSPRGTFEIVVPEMAEAPNLVLFGTPHPPTAPVGSPAAEAARPPIPRVGTAPAREIARFNLKEGIK